MTTHLNSVTYFACVIINSVCGSFFAAAVFGQEVIGDLPPEQWASFVFENYEVVVVGEFPDIPDDVAGNITRQGENEVVIPFEVSAIYKGYVPYDVVQVRLVADMLSYPGEDIARYSKRFETRLEYAAMFEQLNQRFTNLRSDLRSGLVSDESFQAQEAVLLAEQQQLFSESVSISFRSISITHSLSFYDLGGAIEPNESYLLGLNRSRDNRDVLVLEEVPLIQNIFWGRMGTEIGAALDSQSGQ